MKTPVRIIRRKGGYALVQWVKDEVSERAWVPLDIVDESGTSAEVEGPERGVPYGESWSRHITAEISPRVIEQELKRRGIWTFEDYMSQPEVVNGALLSAYKQVHEQIAAAAKENK